MWIRINFIQGKQGKIQTNKQKQTRTTTNIQAHQTLKDVCKNMEKEKKQKKAKQNKVILQ